MNDKYSELIDRIRETFPSTKKLEIQFAISEKDIEEFHRCIGGNRTYSIPFNPEEWGFEIKEISDSNGKLIISHNGE